MPELPVPLPDIARPGSGTATDTAQPTLVDRVVADALDYSRIGMAISAMPTVSPSTS